MISTVTPLESPEVLQRGTIVEFPMTRDNISRRDSCTLVLGGMMLVMEHRLAPVPLECGKISTAWTSTRDSGTLTLLSLQCWVRNLTGQFSCVYSATLTFPSEKHCHGNKRNYLSSHLRKGSTQVCFALSLGWADARVLFLILSKLVSSCLCFPVPLVFRRAFPAGIRWHLPRLPPSYR